MILRMRTCSLLPREVCMNGVGKEVSGCIYKLSDAVIKLFKLPNVNRFIKM